MHPPVGRVAEGIGLTRVMFRCPITDREIPTGVVVDDVPDARSQVPRSGTIVTCDACGRKHAWWRAEIFLEGRPPRPVRREIA